MNTISVIIPAWNAARYLKEAVDSVRRQSRPVDEIIIIDDGSTDDTFTVASSLGPDIIVHRQENRGPAAARNEGIRRSHGTILAFLDADDLWPVDKILVQLSILESDRDAEIVLGFLCHFRENPAHPGGMEMGVPLYLFVVGCGLYRREVFERVGLFDESMRLSEDTDWLLRAREMSVRARIIRKTSVFYRRHDTNVTRGLDMSGNGFLGSLKRSLDRRRAEGGEGNLPPMFRPEDIIDGE